MVSLRQGYCIVPNPFNAKLVRRVSLAPGDLDCIVFWTRDPRPLLPHIDEIERRGFPFYVQMTLTGYPHLVEPHVPFRDTAIAALCALSDRIGYERTIWRYDPIFLAQGPGLELDPAWHRANFERLAAALDGHVREVVVSLLDQYRCTKSRMQRAGLSDIVFGSGKSAGAAATGAEPATAPAAQCRNLPPDPFPELLASLASAAARHGMVMKACAEPWDLSPLGISRGACIDGKLVARVAGKPTQTAKDKGQRPDCGCTDSVDIGSYGKCPAGCIYCYAQR